MLWGFIVNDVYDCGETEVIGWYRAEIGGRSYVHSFNTSDIMSEVIGNKFENPELLTDNN